MPADNVGTKSVDYRSTLQKGDTFNITEYKTIYRKWWQFWKPKVLDVIPINREVIVLHRDKFCVWYI